MTLRLARPFAIAGWVVAALGATTAVALRLADPVPVVANNLGFTDPALVSFEFLGLTFASVGSLLVLRRPGNAVGWVMVVIGVSYALAGLSTAALYSAVAAGPAGAATASAAGWFATLWATIGILIFGLCLIFPTGRGQTPAWDRFVVALGLAFAIVYGTLLLAQPGPLTLFPSIENPLGFGPDVRAASGVKGSGLVIAAGSLLVPVLAWSMASRYRMSDDVARRQMRWFMLAASAAVGAFTVTAVATAMAGQPPEAGLPVFGFAGALVPVAVGIAILRYRLYDIDRLISRSLAYAVVTGTLLAVFATTSVALSLVLGSLAQSESLAVAAATLLVFALFGPLRRRVQWTVNRRFDRASYDASVTVVGLTARLREDVDLERMEMDVLVVVGHALHPSSSGLWLRRNGPGAYHPSVTIPGRHANTVTPT